MKDIIVNCIKYIEAHIEDDLSVESIAKNMGYSKHHFSRLFSSEVGVTLRDYVIEKRLLQSAKNILKGEKIIGVAVKYGYETHTGFSKAFKRQFSYSPSVLIAFRITERILSSEGDNAMKHEALYIELVRLIGNNGSVEQMDLLERAYQFALEAHAGKKRYSGEEYVTHPLQVAIMLAEMEVPIETVMIGLLHDCNEHDSCVSIDDIRNEFGDKCYKKVKRINDLCISTDLLNTVNFDTEEDIVLIKLADRLHNMQTLKFLDQSRWHVKAIETMEIFSPLAEKVGAMKMKAALDSLAIQMTQE